MQAITATNAVLEIISSPIPVPQPDEVLVRTTAIGINYADLLIRKGIYPKPQAIMPGEIEGIIEQAGSNVKHLQAGQKVTGYASEGYAEYATIPAGQAFLVPGDLPIGNGLLTQALTAQHLLSQSGEPSSVIITAAAGGVGTFLIQLAKLKGIKTIIALSGSKEKQRYTSTLGATHALHYNDEINMEADLILDAIGGETPATLVSRLAPHGTMIVYGGTAMQPTNINVQQLMYRSNKIIGSTIYAVSFEQKQRWFDELTGLVRAGKLFFPLTSYPFTDAAKAHQAIEDRETTGKVALIV